MSPVLAAAVVVVVVVTGVTALMDGSFTGKAPMAATPVSTAAGDTGSAVGCSLTAGSTMAGGGLTGLVRPPGLATGMLWRLAAGDVTTRMRVAVATSALSKSFSTATCTGLSPASSSNMGLVTAAAAASDGAADGRRCSSGGLGVEGGSGGRARRETLTRARLVLLASWCSNTGFCMPDVDGGRVDVRA